MEPLTPEERDTVKTVLKGLVKTLDHKKGMGTSEGLLTDESIVLEALKHPERGDVQIAVFRDKNSELDIFVSNRREADSPFSVMGYDTMKRHIERRPLDSTTTIGEDEYGLYIVSFQDRELLNSKSEEGERFYSVNMGIADHIESIVNKSEDLKGKPLEECTPEEKVKIYIENKIGDPRVGKIKNDFFLFELSLKKYNQAAKMEKIYLEPNNYKSTIGQIIRDAYPYRIRVSLREDYPADHKKNITETQAMMENIKSKITERENPSNPEELINHYSAMSGFISDILSQDPEFSRFV